MLAKIIFSSSTIVSRTLVDKNFELESVFLLSHDFPIMLNMYSRELSKLINVVRFN